MRVLIVQYAGDYREAVQRLAASGQETYYAQRYSVETVANLVSESVSVGVLCCITTSPYDEQLPNGVRAIGAGFEHRVDSKQLLQTIERFNPTHLIICTPIKALFDWAIQRKVPVLTAFAGSIVSKGLRGKFQDFLLAQRLNHPAIEWVGSYGMNSSFRLQQLGVKTEKIIPWDFLVDETPGNLPAKSLNTATAPWKLLYIGSIGESKGVGDAIGAVAHLRDAGYPAHLKIIGRDGEGFAAAKIREYHVADRVELAGFVPNSQVEPEMRAADVVLVPSRHEYPEGFPLVIHHALRSRTPIVASDHPMFTNHLRHQSNAMLFAAGDRVALAEAVQSLLSDPALYLQLSEASYATWRNLRLPVKWADLLHRWVSQTEADRHWLWQYRLTSNRYVTSAWAKPSATLKQA